MFLEVTRSGPATILTLDDPARRNALSAELSTALRLALGEAEADPECRGLIVTGRGRAFCAGAVLEDLEAAAAGDTTAVSLVYDAFLAVANSRLPTIAAVNGAAIGAGMNLALACDLRIVSPAARFETRFLALGLHPGGGHSWLLNRAVGWQQAARLLLLGQAVAGEEATSIGLAAACIAPEHLLTTALEWCRGMRDVPQDLLCRTKATLRLAATADHPTVLRHETSEQLRSLGEPAFAASIERMKQRKSGA